MYVCICYAVTEQEIAEHVASGVRDEDELGGACGAGTGCGSCRTRVCEMLRVLCEARHRRVAAASV